MDLSGNYDDEWGEKKKKKLKRNENFVKIKHTKRSSSMHAYDVMWSTVTTCDYRLVTHHLLDPVKALAMEAEGLLKQHFVLHRPVIWEGGEVGQVCHGLLNVVLVPEEHAKSLLDTQLRHAFPGDWFTSAGSSTINEYDYINKAADHLSAWTEHSLDHCNRAPHGD